MTPLTSRPVAFEPDEQARVGVFVSLTHDGRLRVDRCYVGPEDEPVAEDTGVPVGAEAVEQASGPAIICETSSVSIEEAHDLIFTDEAVRRVIAVRINRDQECRKMAISDLRHNGDKSRFVRDGNDIKFRRCDGQRCFLSLFTSVTLAVVKAHLLFRSKSVCVQFRKHSRAVCHRCR